MVDSYSFGQIIFSKAGKDKGKPFVIVGIEDEFVYIADGKLRTIDKPKLKKMKHIQPTKVIAQNLTHKLTQGDKITNSDLKEALENYLNGNLIEGGL
ncbi:MAG: hypothetical protein ATN36_03315 [Epulopiscium sp. Nele67-Bin005]|nr:MAG: hypothetical protein ATN36_03315 [Epulopiscium sp. Nele67-Bin005]